MNGKSGVQVLFDNLDGAHQLADALQRIEFALDGYQDGIHSRQGVDCQQPQGRRAVDKDIVVVVPYIFNRFLEYLFSANNLNQLDLGTSQLSVGRNDIHAIGHYVLEHHKKLKILYVSSEMFTNELITALKEKRNINTFKKKYRNVDVLLIDDIQFIENKEATQEEFFHTFNSLYDLNKQIIISSDRHPNKLTNLDERLRSRFAWNIVADIQPPDYETRVAILMKKAELENIEITDSVLQVINLIAEKIRYNVRELEGAFSRIISFSIVLNKPITVSFAKEKLTEIFSSSDMNITIETIKRSVCKYYNIAIKDIESSRKTRDLAYPRQVAMYLCREMTNNSLPKIGESFGGRDHTTVLHGRKPGIQHLFPEQNV